MLRPSAVHTRYNICHSRLRRMSIQLSMYSFQGCIPITYIYFFRGVRFLRRFVCLSGRKLAALVARLAITRCALDASRLFTCSGVSSKPVLRSFGCFGSDFCFLPARVRFRRGVDLHIDLCVVDGSDGGVGSSMSTSSSPCGVWSAPEALHCGCVLPEDPARLLGSANAVPMACDGPATWPSSGCDEFSHNPQITAILSSCDLLTLLNIPCGMLIIGVRTTVLCWCIGTDGTRWNRNVVDST